jgi:GT2 family glycosyltransferase
VKLSIIIVNWNTCNLTKQTIESVYRETSGIDFEIILTDNASSDDSVEVIKKEFPQVILIENKENLGFGKANNQGMRIALGKYIMLLNSDTVVLSQAITRLTSYLDEHEDITMLGPKLLNEDRTFQYSCRRNLPNPMNSFFHLFGLAKLFPKSKMFTDYKRFAYDSNRTEPVEAISGAAMFFRRGVFDTMGGFDEQFFMYGEDLDFCKRVQDKGWKTMFVHDAEIIHFGGQSSKKRRKQSLVNFYDAMWIYYKKHFYSTYPKAISMFVYLGIGLRKNIALFCNALKK